jgi:hypothetical protein
MYRDGMWDYFIYFIYNICMFNYYRYKLDFIQVLVFEPDSQHLSSHWLI